MSNAPIEPQNYLSGVKVVQIEDLRIARGMSKRPVTLCQHKTLTYDQAERRVWCCDCESTVEPFDAFRQIVEHFSGAQSKIHRRQEELAQVEKFQIRSRAAKVMDEAWRSTSMAPCCPHCSKPILPEDVVKGVSMQTKRK